MTPNSTIATTGERQRIKGVAPIKEEYVILD
jgi:hypothetical protein